MQNYITSDAYYPGEVQQSFRIEVQYFSDGASTKSGLLILFVS